MANMDCILLFSATAVQLSFSARDRLAGWTDEGRSVVLGDGGKGGYRGDG